MGTVVLYASKTGFTKKYAEWIAKGLKCQAIPLDKVDQAAIDQAEVIVFGGGIYAGRINGLKKMQKYLAKWSNKKFIVFATGAGPEGTEEVERVKSSNLSQNQDIPFFYFRSGLNYEKMGLKDKLMMKCFVTILKKQKNKSEADQKALEAMEKSYDVCDQAKIKDLINCVNRV